MVKKIITIAGIIILLVFVNTVVNAKYIFENKFEVANLNIDRTKPIIEVISIENTNKGYENYANKTHIIGITVKFRDKNIDKVLCDKEHIKVKVDKYLQNAQYTKISESQGEKTYKIELKNIEGNGKLTIQFLEGTVIDTSMLENEQIEIDANILIDNIAPNGSLKEEKLSGGKVKAIINLNEGIRKFEGWEFKQNNSQIEKEFTNNISYELPIIDYAGNKAIVNVNITKATYINIIYASHNSEVGWTFGYGNYDIAGGYAASVHTKFKTEALAFNISGNIDSDFVQAQCYVNTHWGEGTYAKCTTSGMMYNYGYNPNGGTYKSMKSVDLVTIENKKYFQFGGSGINTYRNTDTNGNNPIPMDVAAEYRYGICGIKLKLKDYSQFSVIYQILVDGVGWMNACADGTECIYSKTKPMSAFRIALVPNSEKQYFLDTWNKDVGTFNL